MKRVVTAIASLVGLLAVLGAGPASAGPAVPGAPAYNFAAPKPVSNPDGSSPGGKPGEAAASVDGTANNAYPSSDNTGMIDSANTAFAGNFTPQTLDSSPNKVGSERMKHDSRGRIHLIWYHNNGDGTTDVYYARKDPGTGGSPWVLKGPIPGTNNSDGFKVLDVAVGLNDRVYVVYARNTIGAKLIFTDDGVHWSAPEDVPGVTPTASDFAVGASLSGYIAVGWFDRDTTDVLVMMKNPAGAWGPLTDISARGGSKGQDYGPRFATAPDGGLRVAWAGLPTTTAGQHDVYFREWSPNCGFAWTCHPIVQVVSDSGDTNTKSVDVSVDASGQNHVVFDDDINEASRNVRTYYTRGTGTHFDPPQLAFPSFGDVSSRDPDLDVNRVGTGSTVVHITTNAIVTGIFDNYYTWTDAGSMVTPTSTPVPITSTPVVCTPGVFSDVPPGSPFYTWITDLVGRGAVSGYADCTFRPFATITRGQAAKILVIAFGLTTVNPTTGHFSDVPPGSAFYTFVETAYAQGLISGYADGTFRPFNPVTRGQLAKIDALGRGWQLKNPPTATFSDVPVGSPFYQYVETAYSLGVISGYSCGTGCLAFHPFDSATRGQGAKIIDVSITTVQASPTPTVPAPTNTPVVPPSSTPRPPTNTPVVPPSSTPLPPTSTPVPPTDTPVPPTSTPANSPTPLLTSTSTPTPTVPATATPELPIIVLFQPNSVEQYDTVTLVDMQGQFFGPITGTLTVNNVPATIDNWTDTLVEFNLGPNTPASNPTTVQVMSSDGRSATSTLFQVRRREHPFIFSYSPPTVPEGNTQVAVTMQGVQFGVVTGTVILAGIYTATIQSWTDTAIIFHIAADTAAYNPIYVRVDSPLNGMYKEYGGFGVIPATPTPAPATATPTATVTPGLCAPRLTLVRAEQQISDNRSNVQYRVTGPAMTPLTGLTVTYAFNGGQDAGILTELGDGLYGLPACSVLPGSVSSVTVSTSSCGVTIQRTDPVVPVTSGGCP